MEAGSELESITKMESKGRNSDLNNLSASLHSIISGEELAESGNIPFADDEETSVNKQCEKSSDSISSNESYPEKLNFNPGRRRMMFKPTPGHEASCESESDDGNLASEKRDRPGPLASDLQRAAEVSEISNLGVMRRNSISMPVLNENDLDALRNLYTKAVDTSDSKESLTKITVSFFCFTAAVNYLLDVFVM